MPEAEFRSKCPTCGEWIEPGDEIVRDEDEWVHEECAEARNLRFNLAEEAKDDG